ncbi:unnamed protein product [Urochloa decumbens]|uniref:Uncharacterized protein n=1 Tax=Urochloa decumbens TaxID=240449 RepID=A0ABC9D7X2_9POAL
MEGVMVSVVTGAISSLITKFAALLEEKYKLSKGVKKEIASMKDKMSSMNALLVDLSRMDVLNEQQKDWRDKVRELSYDMEDCIDIFFNDCGDGKVGIFKELMASYKIAKRIEELKAREEQVRNCHDSYMVPVSISQPCLVTVDPRMITGFYEDSCSHVGTDIARNKIISWLKEGGQQVEQTGKPCLEPSKKTKVISIVGFGGVGKTALASQVYAKVKGQFDCTAFVSASQNPNMIKIFSDIVSGVGCSEPSSLMDEPKLIDLLWRHLKHKRYLIVVDDVWTIEAWDIIKCSFVENSRGSRVIITTRIEHVANAWCPSFDGHVYRVEPLNDSDSRRLFHRRIFGSEDACPNQLKAISDEILNKCGGLPLAIVTVASILASKDVNSKETWENIKISLGFQLERIHAFGRMRRVFNLGYKDLSLDLRTCMLYLGIFPEDSEIVKDDLVKRWIAEGFVTDNSGYGSKEIVAESYFHELINKNIFFFFFRTTSGGDPHLLFIDRVKLTTKFRRTGMKLQAQEMGERLYGIAEGQVQSAPRKQVFLPQMDDSFIFLITAAPQFQVAYYSSENFRWGEFLSVEDFGISSLPDMPEDEKYHATEENFVTVINDLHRTRSSLKVRRLSLQVRDSEYSNALGNMVLTQVRSFNFWGPAERMPSLSKFQLVRVVHIDVYNSQDDQCDISSLCKFFQLRYLRIRGLGSRQLLIHNKQLCKLQHLETLEIVLPEKTTTLFELDANKLPPTLCHLVVPSTVKLIGAIDKMKALCTLGELYVHPQGVEKNFKCLGELANLQDLKLLLSHPPSQAAHIVSDLLPSSLCRLSSLRSLIIRARGPFSVAEDALTRWNTPSPHLLRLHALVCPFSTVPTDWITQLDSLMSLEIKVVSFPQVGAEVLAQLTSLVHLRLHVDRHAPEEGVIIHRGAFPHLKEFWFAYQVPCLMFKAGAMPMLQSLTVQCYTRAERQADGVLDGIEHLGSLKACRVDIADFATQEHSAFAPKEDVPMSKRQSQDCAFQQFSGFVPKEDVTRWNRKALQAAFSMAISKHPGSLDVKIQSVYSGVGPSDYYAF